MTTLYTVTPRALDALNIIPEAVLERPIRLGDYQTDVLVGRRAWSGADITGKAAGYGRNYAQSRHEALRKVRAAVTPFGVDLVVVKGARGKLTLEWTVAGIPLPAWAEAAERPGLAALAEVA